MNSAISPPNQAELPAAEILESRTTGWIAQCRELHCAPPFGSWVRAPEDAIATASSREVVYGVVSKIETAPFDLNRRPVALWTSEDEMSQRHPQIGKLLRTTFEVQCLGWSEKSDVKTSNADLEYSIYQSLPPQPPRLHSFVLRCDDADVRRFTQKHDWIRLLLNGATENADELIIAVSRHAIKAHNSDVNYSIALGKTLALLLQDDYLRLRAILGRIGM